MDINLIWVGRKQEYFCKRGWTGKSLICPSGISPLFRLRGARWRDPLAPRSDGMRDIHVTSRRRPRESEDPYAATSRFGTLANGFCANGLPGLWVPAFAGTTRVESASHVTQRPG